MKTVLINRILVTLCVFAIAGAFIMETGCIPNRLSLIVCVTAAVFFSHCANASDAQPKRIGNYKRLLTILKQHQPRYYTPYRTGPIVTADSSSGTAAPGGASFSPTMVQVEGVDEGDIVKTDGVLIYQINQNRVLIINAQPLWVVRELEFEGNFQAQELYLEKDRLVVVGRSSVQPVPNAYLRRMNAPFFSNGTVQVKTYRVNHETVSPVLLREIEVEGDLVATRKIGSRLFIVTRDYPECEKFSYKTAATLRLATPAVRDSRLGKKFRNLSPMNTWYFPGFDDPNFLVVTALDMENSASAVRVTAFLGAGEAVYASTEDLFVTASTYWDAWFAGLEPDPAQDATLPAESGAVQTTIFPIWDPPSETTEIYKFSLAGERPVFSAAGRVPGVLLNSYSMDEHEGYLRLATTERTRFAWTGSSANNVFVLDEGLEIVGEIRDLAPGERIYAARFLGPRLFMVTFRQIDPLFAVDLSNPMNPTVTGELKVPGYSGCLLPLNENFLIGIGKDVEVLSEDSGTQPWPGVTAFVQRLQVSLFDVSDMSQPVLTDIVTIGTRGSDSPALYDPHAILLDPARGLLSFPVTVTETNEGALEPWESSITTFQGAYVFNVSPETGLTYKGAVSHVLEGEDIWDYWRSHVSRVISIGSDLYTLSDSTVRANDIDTLEDRGSTLLPEAYYDYGHGFVSTMALPGSGGVSWGRQ